MAFCLEHSAAVVKREPIQKAVDSISMYQFKVAGGINENDGNEQVDHEYLCSFGFADELEREEAQERAKMMRPLSRSKSMFLLSGSSQGLIQF